MSPNDPPPLWREVVGDTEPWRRGRIAVVLFGVLTLLNQILVFGTDILSGNIEHLLVVGLFALLFWLQFYFIWVGIHWVRWLNAVFSGLAGFAFLIWGVRDGSPLLTGTGAYLFAVAAYIGFAPSVYFFAQHQRERTRWKENLIVAAVMLLLLFSCAAAGVGLSAYRNQRVAQGREFADRALRKIFVEHDAEFLINHSAPRTLENNGQLRWRVMMTEVVMRCGEVHNITPANGWLRSSYRWPATLVSQGRMYAEGAGAGGGLFFQLNLTEASGDWEIDGVLWQYR